MKLEMFSSHSVLSKEALKNIIGSTTEQPQGDPPDCDGGNIFRKECQDDTIPNHCPSI